MERTFPFPRLAVALDYSFSDERHTAGRPAMARAADARLSEPGPFSGMDGAAETATARKFLEGGLSRLHFAALRARYGQRKSPCKFCGCAGDHLEWLAAIRGLADELAEFLAMPSVNSEMRIALLRRLFEGKDGVGLEDLAKRHDCSLSTSKRASAKTSAWIKGARKAKPSDAAVYGVEQGAHAAAEKLLRDGGFIP